jgi:hypothetical protein
MLLVIDAEKLSPEFRADLDRMAGNANISPYLANQEHCFSQAELRAPLTTPLQPNEPIIVLAHSGYRDDNGQQVPWVAGRDFTDFANDLIAKFGVVGLTGRMLYFITCTTGPSARILADRLSAGGVRSTDLYLPNKLVFVSKAGIPHVFRFGTSEKDEKEANTLVARYHAEYKPLTPYCDGTGVEVTGARIAANGTTAKLSADEAQATVGDFFDPQDTEG